MAEPFTINPNELDTSLTKCIGVRVEENLQYGDRLIIGARRKNPDGSLGPLYRRVVTVYPEAEDDRPALLAFLRKEIDILPESVHVVFERVTREITTRWTLDPDPTRTARRLRERRLRRRRQTRATLHGK